jgi:hypothetical protein
MIVPVNRLARLVRQWRRHNAVAPRETLRTAAESYTDDEIIGAINKLSSSGRLWQYRDVENFVGLLKARRQMKQMLQEVPS